MDLSSPVSAVAINPLRELHERAGAEFQPYADIEIVSTFGQPQAEYAAFHKGAALLDQPQRAVVELTGEDRLPFLNNLITNQTWNKATKSGLAAGEGVYAFLLNGKGRIITDLNVLELGDRTLLELEVRLAPTLIQELDRFLFRDKVKIVSRVGELHSLALHGAGAASVLAEACAPAPPELPPLGSFATRLFDADCVIWRDDLCGAAGYGLLIPTAAAAHVWTQLVSRFFDTHEHGRRRLRPAGWAMFNTARIEAGRPLFGIDFDDSLLPAETGQMSRAVSLTKGCYLGQEIVARMDARKQVARQIVGLKMNDDALPIAGAILTDDQDNQVGGVTSSTLSPILSNACLCLALVKKGFNTVGTIMNVPAEGAMRKATVVELPFR